MTLRGRVLLFNPWIYDFTAFDLWSKPLGLLYLGAHLRRRGWEVHLLDCMDRLDPAMPRVSSGSRYLRDCGCGGYYKEVVPKPTFFQDIPRFFGRFGLPFSIVRERLEKMSPPDVIFITCGMSYWYPGAVFSGELLRDIFPSSQICLGGVYPTLCSEHAQRWGFDLVVDTVDPILSLRKIENLLGEDFEVQAYADFFSLSPDFSFYQNLSYGVLLTSVGCPFRCAYCASGYLYPSFFRRPWQDVMQEILHLFQKFKVRHFVFYDDALLFKAEELSPLFYELARQKLPISFHLPNGIHVRYVTATIAQLMRQAGFRTIRLSLEIVSSFWQEKTGGKVNREEFERAVCYFQEAGFLPKELEVYLLFGWPGCEKEEIKTSFEYVRGLGLIPRLALYAPTPHTSFYQTLSAPFQKEPLWHNKIAYLYATGNDRIYEELQRRGGE
ncbi:MAG: B12-binding domain-containing radical SAM protein [Candidatus Caldatribacteriaceae bacterium]